MGCGCNKGNEVRPDVNASAVAPGNTMSVPVEIRSGGHPLACWDCLAKHIAAAHRLYVEFMEDNSREAEKLLCFGNLMCAKQHADALKCKEASDMCRLLLGKISGGDRVDFEPVMACLVKNAGNDGRVFADPYLKMIGCLSAAEDYARFAGRDDVADAIRGVRLSSSDSNW